MNNLIINLSFMKKILVPVLALATIFTSCKRDDNNGRNNIFKGPETQVHGGKAWTWVQVDNEGNPLRLAVTLNDAVLNSVPAGNGSSSGHDMMDNMWTLKFHPKAGVTEFNHVGMGWNPNGHEPEHIYDQPHFDFHFYMMTPDEVAAIPTYDQAKAKFDNWPAATYFPANYFNAGGGVPMMGAHWVDPTSHEFHGQLFTETFIFGSYEGKVTFYEPMITLAFLKNNNNFERGIPQPSKVQKSGYYPTKLRVVKHDGLTDIILDEFVYRTQS
jgi:hypothetical protein